MASESVVAAGIEYLLEPVLVPRDPVRTIKSASNVRTPISPGIAAIGDLLWRVSSAPELELPRQTAHDLGVLLKMLAELDSALGDREVNAYQCLLDPAAYLRLGGSPDIARKEH